MEHRCSPRRNAEYHLMFYQHGQVVQSGCVKNISMGGLFIQVSAGNWRRHEAFDVELVSSRGAKLRLSAELVHKHSHGVGIVFDSMDIVQRQMLRDLFYIGIDQAEAPISKADVSVA
ncbi:MAG: PilZ domain-containing protein [Gammaproteobacteria bacterium]